METNGFQLLSSFFSPSFSNSFCILESRSSFLWSLDQTSEVCYSQTLTLLRRQKESQREACRAFFPRSAANCRPIKKSPLLFFPSATRTLLSPSKATTSATNHLRVLLHDLLYLFPVFQCIIIFPLCFPSHPPAFPRPPPRPPGGSPRGPAGPGLRRRRLCYRSQRARTCLCRV